jgi:tetratricopeptide (TPR) repeat protein
MKIKHIVMSLGLASGLLVLKSDSFNNFEPYSETFISQNYDNKNMPLKQSNIRSFSEITKPTKNIIDKAENIAKTSKTTEEALKMAVDYVAKRFSYLPRSVALPQTPIELEKSGKGDCNEYAYYLFALLNEIQQKSNFNFQPKLVEVYILDNGEHTNHFALKVNLNGKDIHIDPLALNKIDVKHRLVRELTPTQVVAAYYCDAGVFSVMNGNYKEGEKFLLQAIKIDRSPSILYNISKLYSYKGDYSKALHYANELLKLEPNWIYSYIRVIQTYYEMEKYDKAMEIIKSAEKVQPGKKTVEMYKRLINQNLDLSR